MRPYVLHSFQSHGIRYTPVVAVACISAALTPAWAADAVVKRFGVDTLRVDVSRARPGGLLVVNLSTSSVRATASAVFLGTRHLFFDYDGRLRAFVPVPLGTPAGTTLLGVEIRQRRRRRRVVVDIKTEAIEFGSRLVALPPAKQALIERSETARDGRRILGLLKTVTPHAQWRGPFRPPVHTPPSASFGMRESIAGSALLNRLLDGLHDEFHRGLDFIVPSGTVVQAPAAGTVLLASSLAASGETIVIDHGQGVLSVLFHLSRIEVREGQWIEGRSPIALSGDTGLVASPKLHWGVYIGGVAVDPRVLYFQID